MSGSNSQENYLDQLLKSVDNEKKKTKEEKEYEAKIQSYIGDEEDDIVDYKQTVRERVLKEQILAKEEEDFIREFEEELLREDSGDILRKYEEGLGLNRDEEFNPDAFYNGEVAESDEEFYRGFENPADVNAAAETEVPEETEAPEEIEVPEEIEALEEIEAPEDVNEMFEDMDNILETVAANINGESDGIFPNDVIGEEPNLAGGDDDLFSLLAESEDFADIGDLLSEENGPASVEGEDVFAAFADSELEKQESEQNGISTPKKKQGFFAKLMNGLFGPDEDEEVVLNKKQSVDVTMLSSENDQILMEFETLEAGGEAPKGKKDKKAKKEKKEKKEKAPKPKKEKKPKEPKPKKEKMPKEKDNTPPLPKKPVALICLFAVSLLVLIILGMDLVTYNSKVSEAKTLFSVGQYANAYENLTGIEIKEKDTELYNQLTILAAPDGEWNSYRIFSKANDQINALDALINAAGRCEVNAENAVTYQCEGYLNSIKNKVSNELKDVYGMTYEEAIEMYDIRRRDDYTIALHEKLEELGLK